MLFALVVSYLTIDSVLGYVLTLIFIRFDGCYFVFVLFFFPYEALSKDIRFRSMGTC